MTDEPRTPPHDSEHEEWDELVAAQALHALEPVDEIRLDAHVASCATCRARLDDFALVAAQLGALADDDETQPPVWGDLRSRIVASGEIRPQPAEQEPAGPDRVVPLSPRRQRRPAPWLLAVAASAVFLAAGGVLGWQLTRPQNGPAATAAISACRHQNGCRVILLHPQGGGDGGAVLVDAERASMVPLSMPAPDQNHMYVLWQLPRDGSPIPVVAFRALNRQTRSVPLVTSYRDTAAFAVSVESAGPMPSKPTSVLAIGATV